MVVGVGAGHASAGSGPRCPELPDQGPVTIRWAQVHESPGCYFFSGPNGLGVDDTLGTDADLRRVGDGVELEFGRNVIFRGTSGGDDFLLRRTSSHRDGDWKVHERIRGRFTRDAQGCPVIEAHYEYNECPCGHAGPCVTRCTIEADLEARP